MEVIDFSGILLWPVFWSGSFQCSFFLGSFRALHVRCWQLTGTSFCSVSLTGQTHQPSVERQDSVSSPLCVARVPDQGNILCLALLLHSVESWSFLNITLYQGFPSNLPSECGCWAWLGDRTNWQHLAACAMDCLHLLAAASASLSVGSKCDCALQVLKAFCCRSTSRY